MQSHIEHPGGLSIRNGQNRSHFMFSQKSESHQRSRFHFATPMMVLYRNWANDLRRKWPNWNTYFARMFLQKRPENLCNFLIERPLSIAATLGIAGTYSYLYTSKCTAPVVAAVSPLRKPSCTTHKTAKNALISHTHYNFLFTTAMSFSSFIHRAMLFIIFLEKSF